MALPLQRPLLLIFLFFLNLPSILCSFPAIFIFGDSLFDAGNNDHLITLAKADRLPYGRDFPGHRPTGRFCNGPLSVDYLASRAGLPFPPAYLKAGENILQGASFASAGAGILNATGELFGERVDFSQQVTYFSEAKQRLIAFLGNVEAGRLISKSLFVTFLGNNDYLINYFSFPFRKSTSQQLYSLDEFRDLLISAYGTHLTDLYAMGARKFAVVSLPPISCIPIELLFWRSKDGQCKPEINDAARNFNAALSVLLDRLQGRYADAYFVYLNSYDSLWRTIQDPTAYGFTYGHNACCGAGPYGGLPCFNAIATVCENASQYVFWDMAHPTSAYNDLVASLFWEGAAPDVHPINIKELAEL